MNMNVPKGLKYFIVNNSNNIKSFFATKEEAIKVANDANAWAQRRPSNEYGQIMGDFNFKVKEIEKDIDFSEFNTIDTPRGAILIAIGDKYFKEIGDAINYYIKSDQKEKFIFLVEYRPDMYD